MVVLARPTVLGCDSVSAENTQSARALTQHLIDHGRRQHFFVGDPDRSPDTQERYLGFTETLSASGASAAGRPIRVDFDERSGALVAAKVIAHPHGPDALVCANDELALSTMKALRSSCGCPEMDEHDAG